MARSKSHTMLAPRPVCAIMTEEGAGITPGAVGVFEDELVLSIGVCMMMKSSGSILPVAGLE